MTSRFAVLALSLLVLVPSPLHGQARARTPQVEAALVPEALSVRPGTPLRVALRLSVAPGWHVYWKNPGESGLPTTVRWELPAGFRAGSLWWPYPEREELSSVVAHVYRGEVLLLAELHPSPHLAPRRRVEVAARVGWGVCREVCIPQEVRLSLSLPVDKRAPRLNPRWGRIETVAGPRIPHSLAGWVLRARRGEEGILLGVTPGAEGRLPSGPVTFFPEDAAVFPAAVSALPERDGRGFLLRTDGPDPAAETPARLRGVLVAPAGWDRTGRIRALRVDVPINHPEKD